jgi:hypothetical protein
MAATPPGVRVPTISDRRAAGEGPVPGFWQNALICNSAPLIGSQLVYTGTKGGWYEALSRRYSGRLMKHAQAGAIARPGIATVAGSFTLRVIAIVAS